MGKDIIAMFYREPDRLHHAMTKCRTVARVDIDVSAPETFWTVIGVPISFHNSATVHTDEIFDVALEPFAHRFASVRVA